MQPVLPILDALYSTRAVLEKLALQHGEQPGKWPPAVVKQLRQRHNQLTARIERHICSLANAGYYPIGEPTGFISVLDPLHLSIQRRSHCPKCYFVKIVAAQHANGTLVEPVAPAAGGWYTVLITLCPELMSSGLASMTRQRD